MVKAIVGNGIKKRVIFYGLFTVFIVVSLYIIFLVAQQNGKSIRLQTALSHDHVKVNKGARREMLEHAVTIKAIFTFRHQFFKGFGQPYVNWSLPPKQAIDSDWINKERDRISKLTLGNTYDVIVLPVQMRLLRSDKISRTLSAEIIADAIRTTTGQSVMPVQLVESLVGNHSYHISDETVASLAKIYKAKTVISLYVGQTEDKNKHYELGYYAKTAGQSGLGRIFALDQFSDTNPLELMVGNRVDAILKSLYPDARPYVQVNYTTAPKVELGKNINSLLTAKDDPYTQAVNLELLGMLTSHIDFRQRDGYMERALIALRHVNPATKNYDLLYARAMFYLYRRPVALETIKNDHSAEANALRDMLNGNYTELKQEVFAIDDPVFRLFSYFDVNDLAYQYGSDITTVNKGQLVHYMKDDPGWSGLVENRRRDLDGWYAPNPTRLLLGMSKAFPDISMSLVSILKQKSVVGDIDAGDAKSDFIFMDAYKHEMDSMEHALNMNIDGEKITPYDLLKFYRAIGISSVLRKIDKDLDIYGLPDDAESLSNLASNYFSGNPAYISRKIRIDGYKLDATQGDEHLKYLKDLIETSASLEWLDENTDPDTIYAEYYRSTYLKEYYKQFKKTVSYNQDFSAGFDVPSGYRLYEYFGYPTALAYTYHRFALLKAVFKNKGKLLLSPKSYTMAQLEQELSTRFDGHNDKLIFIADRYQEKGDMASVLKVLKKAVEEKSENWSIYLKLGKIYLRDGELKKASDTFNAFPAFAHPSNTNSVQLSNNSYTVGTLLYFAGDYQDAIPLLQYSARLDTGSSGSLSAAYRLAMLDKKYLAALKMARYNARRYNDEFRYRDFLTLLSLLGYPDQTEEGFKVLAPRYSRGQAWLSLFVSQRRKKLSLDDIVDWVNQYENVQSEQVVLDANGYLLLQALTDRHLTSAQSQKLSSGFRSDAKVTYLNRATIPKTPMYRILMGMAEAPPPLLRATTQSAQKRHVAGPPTQDELRQARRLQESTHSMGEFNGFFTAYEQLASGHYNQAYQSFALYSNFFPPKEKNYKLGNLVIPYIAYAAIRSGNTDKMETYLASNTSLSVDSAFDYHLTKAILAAGNRDIDTSLKSLDDAFNRKPEVDQRAVFYWYELTQFCVWLGDTTHDKRYIDKALKWVKIYEVIQPQYGWAYAFEAKYAHNTQDRIRAAAFSEYLDPRSLWLSTVPKSIRQKARHWWKEHNPYVIQNNDDSGSQNRVKT